MQVDIKRQLLKLLGVKAMTLKQLSNILTLTPQDTNAHLQQMEQSGLIEYRAGLFRRR